MRGHSPWLLGLLSVSMLVSCRPDDPGTTDTDPTEGPDPTEGMDPTDGGDALQACRELPEAEAARWVEGTSLQPTGESTPARIEAAGAQTWVLALDLLRATEPRESLAASPTSMALALGMTERLYEGGQCGAEIHARMHYTEEGDALHHTLGASIRILEGRALPPGTDGEDPVVVSLRQSIWDLRGGREPQPLYGATLHEVTGELGAVRTVMNCVIEAESRGLLVDFIPPHLPAGDTTSFDLDVAYLQAPWVNELTAWGAIDFTKDDGATVELPSMGGVFYAGLHQDEQRLAIELSLRGGELAVLLVRPAYEAPQELGGFTADLTAEALAEIRSGSDYAFVDLTMPMVDIPSRTIDYYDPLGFECEPYTLRAVLHGAAVQMDDKGIKAAAATAAESWDTGEPDIPTDVRLDRPFLFFVYDRPTGFVLYSGRFAG